MATKEGTSSSQGIVKLNIGGVPYETTESTLLSHPNSFFSSLLSQRLPTTLDANGAYFIDRTGEYFLPVLHYLRTRHIFIPHNIDLEAVQEEARYYLLGDLVDEIAAILKQKTEEKERKDTLLLNGAYVNAQQSKAFIFRGEEQEAGKRKLVVVRAKEDIVTQSKLAFAFPGAFQPALWSNDEQCRDDLAQFFANHFKRGFYASEGNSLVLTVDSTAGSTINIPALLCDEGKNLLVCDRQFVQRSFSVFTFMEFA
eukprot:m.39019 g.39019  ORF g.39019 m.39019 type:complete len:255 (+) comp32660_c0_seq1:89-853(+)